MVLGRFTPYMEKSMDGVGRFTPYIDMRKYGIGRFTPYIHRYEKGWYSDGDLSSSDYFPVESSKDIGIGTLDSRSKMNSGEKRRQQKYPDKSAWM